MVYLSICYQSIFLFIKPTASIENKTIKIIERIKLIENKTIQIIDSKMIESTTLIENITIQSID